MSLHAWVARGAVAVLVGGVLAAGGGGEAAAAGWWRPKAGLSWQWQLSGKLDLSVKARVYDVDGAGTSKAQVRALHRAGRKAVCYVNAGAYEEFRADKGRFPASVLGKPLDGWPGERWLDVRRWDVLKPIMKARFQVCKNKGFDGVEPDNVDGFANDTGFALKPGDQLKYNRRIARLAHSAGLAVGLKNDVGQAKALEPAFDFAVNEECATYRECGRLSVFVKRNKPVFHVEYELAPKRFCPAGRRLGFSSMRKHWNLDAWRRTC